MRGRFLQISDRGKFPAKQWQDHRDGGAETVAGCSPPPRPPLPVAAGGNETLASVPLLSQQKLPHTRPAVGPVSSRAALPAPRLPSPSKSSGAWGGGRGGFAAWPSAWRLEGLDRGRPLPRAGSEMAPGLWLPGQAPGMPTVVIRSPALGASGDAGDDRCGHQKPLGASGGAGVTALVIRSPALGASGGAGVTAMVIRSPWGPWEVLG